MGYTAYISSSNSFVGVMPFLDFVNLPVDNKYSSYVLSADENPKGLYKTEFLAPHGRHFLNFTTKLL